MVVRTFDELYTILGQTVDFLFIDLRKVFSPNNLSLLLEAVRGGGIIFILGLPDSQWGYSINKKRFSKNRPSILLDWFLENASQNPHCIINKASSSDVIVRFNPMPYNTNFAEQINNIFVTQDQKNLIKNITQEILDLKHPNSCSILTANRGRGKSASIGLVISEVIVKKGMRPFKVILTSPHPINVQVLFNFLLKGLNSERIKYQVIKNEGWISEIRTSLKTKIMYLVPNEINQKMKADLFVVDEAAAIPIEILKEISRTKTKKIFVSTIHGYEGAGRGFQYKFIPYLQNQKVIHYIKFSLDQPIRYLKNDSIEKLLNDTFLLNVDLEHPKINYENIIKKSINIQEYQDSKYLFSKKGLPHLKKNFGLLIYAHYRNQPNDLLLLADSNNHFLVGVYGNDNQDNEFLLVSNQLAREGMMTDHEIQQITNGRFIEGNLIPAVAIRHFSKEFAKLNGLRIVRIATHPSLINKGFGRLSLRLQHQMFSSYDWIGTSFGLTVKLMKFWGKFGFKSIHIRPTKTPGTGEWNIVVIKPITASANTIISKASADFLLQFITLLKHSLHSMSPELVIQIIRSCNPVLDYKPRITSSGMFRLKNYLMGNINFLLIVDVVYELATKYFVSPKTAKLSSSQETLLITRVLQGRTWGQTLSKTGLDWKSANGLLEKAIAKVAHSYI